MSARRHAAATGILRTLATASCGPGMLQPRFEPTDKLAGPVPNILGHDRDNYPSQILQCCGTSTVAEKRVRARCASQCRRTRPRRASRATRNRAARFGLADPRPGVASTGCGNPPSIITRRASLSIGDSAFAEANSSNSRVVTMPRRPECRASSDAGRRAAAHAAAQRSVQRGQDSRPTEPTATSIAVHDGAVADRPPTTPVARPARRCTTRPSVDRNCRPPGLSTCRSPVRSVSKP